MAIDQILFQEFWLWMIILKKSFERKVYVYARAIVCALMTERLLEVLDWFLRPLIV